MQTYSRYNVFCSTENSLVTSDYRSTPPTVCPNNNTHVLLNTFTPVITATIPSSTTQVYQGGSTTQGYFQTSGKTVNIPAAVGQTITVTTFPYPIAPNYVVFLPTPNNAGDTVSIRTLPVTLGVLTAQANAGTRLVDMTIVPQVIFELGFLLQLTNGATTEIPGQIIAFDTTTNEATLSGPLVNTYPVGSTVSVSAIRVNNMPLVNTNNIEVGSNRITSRDVPANTSFQIIYTNNNGLSKTFSWYSEYMY
jgi:hypothetical protein